MVLRFGVSVHDDRQLAADPDREQQSASARKETRRPTGGATTCSRTAVIWSTPPASWEGRSSAVRARLLERFGVIRWFVAVDFADGSLGHLDLQIPVRGDFQEGFQVRASMAA